ncbi:MAG: hypothetical protein ACRC6M_08220 [Microcystaceae cyanobacterium]
MSLTSELKNPDSKVNKFFDAMIPEEVTNQFIAEHNRILSNASIIYPSEKSDLMLVGSAMSHAFYNQVTGEWGFDKPTMATWAINRVIKGLKDQLISVAKTAKTPTQKALIALVLAYYDGVGRGRPDRELYKVIEANVFNKRALPANMNDLALREHDLLWSVWDVEGLIDSFHLKWVDGLKSNDIHINASFAGSHFVNGADAQMISNGMLIDIKTSKLKAPFTKKDLYQQLAYWFLDYDNQYSLNEIVWVYPRHQMFLRYGIGDKFPALPERSQKLIRKLS